MNFLHQASVVNAAGWVDTTNPTMHGEIVDASLRQKHGFCQPNNFGHRWPGRG